MLATIGIVDCISVTSASACPISILVHGERPFYLRLNGAERNKNINFLSPTVGLSPSVYYLS